MDEFTRKFNTSEDREVQTHYILSAVYDALKEKGYDPINQIVGYILSEDPTYITNHNGARTLICKLDRDEMLQALVKNYIPGGFLLKNGEYSDICVYYIETDGKTAADFA